MRPLPLLLIIVGLLAGCSTSPHAATAPSPSMTGPPSAWLIIGDTTVHGTQGSSCGPWGCWDMVEPQEMPGGVATADLPPGAPATIVVDYAPLTAFSVFVQDWSSEVFPPEGGDPVAAEGTVEGNQTILTLAPITDTDDKLLSVSFASSSPQGNIDASYTWHLNPARGRLAKQALKIIGIGLAVAVVLFLVSLWVSLNRAYHVLSQRASPVLQRLGRSPTQENLK